MADSFNELFGLGSHSPDANLEGWWPLQDDAASTTVVDESGNSRSGVLNSDIAGGDTSDVATTGPNSWLTSAFEMDGDNYIDVGLANYLDNSAGFTGLCRANLDVQNDNAAFISDWDSAGDGHVLCRQGTSGQLEFFVNDTSQTGGTISPSTAASATAGWQTFSYRFDGSNLTAGIDGTYASVSAGGSNLTSSNTNNLHCGASPHGISGDGIDGQVADFVVFSRSLTNSEVSQWLNGPEPVNSVAPSLSGTETEGETLSCTTGTWGLDSPFSSGSNGTITYSYQWTRSDDGTGTNEADIGSATSSTYTLTASDVGKYIRCRVRATNDGGYDADADTNSDFTGAIASSSSSTVEPNDCTHGHTAESPTITQAHAITPNDCSHTHTVDSPAVTQTHSISPNSASHAHTVDSPAISQVHAIAPNSSTHAHTAESPTVSTVGTITPNDCSHAHTADSPAVTQTHSIVPNDASHAHTCESPAVAHIHVVTPVDCLHSHTAESPVISQLHTITPADCLHAHTCESPNVTPEAEAVTPIKFATLPTRRTTASLPERRTTASLPED